MNATGLGKTSQETPLIASARFPHLATVWDLNYRGPLPFLAGAQEQASRRSLRVHDGWRLFALGWLEALGALLNIHPPAGIADTFVATGPRRAGESAVPPRAVGTLRRVPVGAHDGGHRAGEAQDHGSAAQVRGVSASLCASGCAGVVEAAKTWWSKHGSSRRNTDLHGPPGPL